MASGYRASKSDAWMPSRMEDRRCISGHEANLMVSSHKLRYLAEKWTILIFILERWASHPGLTYIIFSHRHLELSTVGLWEPKRTSIGEWLSEALPRENIAKCWVLVSEFETCHEVASCKPHKAQVGSRPIYANTAVPFLYAAQIRKTPYTPKGRGCQAAGDSACMHRGIS